MERKIKVHASSAYKYKQVPTLMLKGDYLKAFGFNIDTKVSVRLEPERIIITPIKQECNE
ncbi:MAG: SymE family type I addiction module toxin [Lachnospiraceae bacterium]|nr:SymE family type I addiction module toxin [Lachnospiraceae bacterium]